MKYLIILFLIYFSSFHNHIVTASDREQNNGNSEIILLLNGEQIIYLAEELQKSSGLKTLILKQVKFKPESIAYGKALNPASLLTIRHNYLLASTQKTGTKSRLLSAEKNISRLRNLHQNELVSTRKLQNQQSQWQSNKAAYDATHYQRQLIVNNSRLQWGELLTQWITDENPVLFDNLIKGNTTLLQITLPSNNSLSKDVDTVFIDPAGHRNSAISVSFICQLPQVDNFSQGHQYIFQTDNPKIKIGMSFTAWIPGQQQLLTGVIVPESSVLWHLGQAFVFIKKNEEQFIHRSLNNPVKVSSGYFIIDQINPGDEVVVTGAQMLLSHEFKSQIPSEDDDD